MKLFYKLLTLTLVFSLLMACSSDNDNEYENRDPNITVTASEFTLGAEDNLEETATFSITRNWELTITYEGNAKDWLTATPNSGKAGENKSITFKATKNMDATRKASINIHYEGEIYTLSVLQKRAIDQDITSEFDSKFASELQKREYIADAKKIMLSEVETITKINISGDFEKRGQLTSLRGIEYFAFLTELDCQYNLITNLDLSKNTALNTLYCNDNKLSELNVDNNILLKALECRGNTLTKLDVSKNVSLAYLDCGGNQLADLNISKNTELVKLMCSSNKISNLDLAQNIKLETLYCISNNLKALNVSTNTALVQLECYYNYELSKIDVTKNIALRSLGLGFDKITELDLSKNTELVEFHCGGSAELTSLDISKNSKLTFLNAAGCALKTLDISNNKLLTSMYCSENPGESGKFIVKAWFDNSTIPSENFSNKDWKFDGKDVVLEYKK